nr:hypothetical protein [uncultured Dethiosulfovibrio sp.]
MLVKGQRQVLEGDTVRVSLLGVKADMVCFLLDENSKASGPDKVALSWNNPFPGFLDLKGEGAVSLSLPSVPPSVDRIALAYRSSQIPSACSMKVESGSFSDTCDLGADLDGAKDGALVEIYRKSGKWRFSVEAQGFPKGFGSLSGFYGLPDLAIPEPPAAPAPSTSPVSLSKITLEKRGEKKLLSLEKKEGQRIRINLNWDSKGTDQQPKKGFFSSLLGGGSGEVDLDLGCMFEMKDGHKGVIQPLGGYLGSQSDSPFILLDKDDRSGSSSDGENMTIFRPELLSRVLIFAFIYEGTARFSDVNGRLTIDTGSEEITIKLDNPESGKKFCAVGLFENQGTGLELSKQEIYFDNHKPCDEHYRFGFNWKAGRK